MTLKVNLAINFAFLKASNIHLDLKLLKDLLKVMQKFCDVIFK